MDRRPRNRIRKIEQLVSAAKKERHEKRRKTYDAYRLDGRLHATAVAAIVLAGDPKVDEPLVEAWTRALQHYGIGVNLDETARIKNQRAAARQLSPKIIGDAKQSTKFTEIFRTAPVWLLNFTNVFLDAAFLQFDLPREPCKAKWGTIGYEQLREWPLLPLGTMAGRSHSRGTKATMAL
jgi:hypothetical protein